MTHLEAVLAFALLVSAVGHVLQARAHDHTLTERDYLRGLYADAVAQLEAATRERDYYKREWAARRDDWARRAGQPERHIGAGE